MTLMNPRGRPTASTSVYSPPVDSAVARNSNRRPSVRHFDHVARLRHLRILLGL